ncbi:hypothetical protein CPB85DRAFT_893897 [Mucidula mucida]|nr:hypothetical protein CPB85DRAFT_893897 [Mucidula mucida]
MQSHTKTINDLPNELVYLILGNLALEDLIPLGCVSRKFNILAFTSYFSLVHGSGVLHLLTTSHTLFSTHYTFDNTPYTPGTSLMGRTQRHPFCTLSALRLAVLVRQPVYSVGASFTMARFLEEADHLQKYLRTAPELVSIQLTLPTVGAPYYGDARGFRLDELKEEQYGALCRVLEALQFVRPRASGLTWIVSGNFTLSDDAAPFTGVPLSNVHSVSLRECRVLVSPPLKDWTIASLHQSQVQILEIDGSILAPYHQSIHLPHLLNLKIHAYTGTTTACFSLGTFLSRHPSLENVLIVSDIKAGAGGFNYHLEDNALPNVTTISAPLEYLILWLSKASVLSSVTTVNARSCSTMVPVTFGNARSPEQISVVCALIRELLTFMSRRPTISSFYFPLCELRSGDIFPAGLDISHIRTLHCTPEYMFEMTAGVAEEICAMLAGFTGAEKLVVNQNWRSHGGWTKNLVPRLNELCPGISLQLVG